jgi:hypothetical protein
MASEDGEMLTNGEPITTQVAVWTHFHVAYCSISPESNGNLQDQIKKQRTFRTESNHLLVEVSMFILCVNSSISTYIF